MAAAERETAQPPDPDPGTGTGSYNERLAKEMGKTEPYDVSTAGPYPHPAPMRPALMSRSSRFFEQSVDDFTAAPSISEFGSARNSGSARQPQGSSSNSKLLARLRLGNAFPHFAICAVLVVVMVQFLARSAGSLQGHSTYVSSPSQPTSFLGTILTPILVAQRSYLP
jgi:hypothetical protein